MDPNGPQPPATGPAVGGLEPESVGERIDLKGRGLREHTARGVLINGAFQVGFASLGILQRVAAAAFLTASEFGIWGILLTTLLTLAFLKSVGISDKYVQQSELDQEVAFQKAFTLELAYSAALWALVAMLLPAYALIYGHDEILAPGLVLSLVLLTGVFNAPLWITYRRMQFVRQRLLESIDPIVTTTVIVILAIADAGVWALVIGPVVGSIATGVAAVATCPYRLRIRYDRGTFREYLSFSWPLALSGFSGLLIVQGTFLVGNYTVGLTGLGLIALTGSFTVFADRVEKIINRTVYPAITAVKSRRELLLEVFETSNRLGLMWGFPFGIGVAIFARDLVEFVLGDKWIEATPVLVVFGLIVAFSQIAVSWGMFFNAIGDTRPLAVSGVVALLVFAVVVVPLMFWLEMTGYLIGSAVALVVQLGVRMYFLRRLFTGFNLFGHGWRAIAPSLPAVGLVFASRALTGERTLALALAELALYVVATLIATLVFERRLLQDIVGYVRGGARGPLGRKREAYVG